MMPIELNFLTKINIMKKTLLLFTAVFGFGFLIAQTSNIQQIEKGVSNFRGQSSNKVVLKKHNALVTPPKTSLAESFEGTAFPPLGWTFIDGDGDGQNWFAYTGGSAHTGAISAVSASWTSTSGALTPNNHLITPALIPVTGDTLSFWFAAQDPAYPADKFQVLVSTTGKATSNFIDTLFVKTITDSAWTQKKLSLAAFVGDTIYVSFNHFDCTDWFYMKIDDVSGPATYTPPDMAVSNIIAPYSACGLGSEDVTIELSNNGAISVSSFDVAFKVDNGTYTTETYSGTALAPFTTATYTFTAKANLSAAGLHTVTAKVIYSSDADASNDLITINADHLSGKTIPYTMGFETGESLEGWSVIDVAQDGYTWYTIENGVNPNLGTGYAYCISPSSDDWLITTCLNLVSGQNYGVSAWAKTKVNGNEAFSIMLGQGNTATALTTNLKDATVAADIYDKYSATFTVATAGEYFVGFHANSSASTMTMYLDDIMIDDLFTGIEKSDISNSISMYPNPAKNLLKIRSTTNISNIKIVNIIGQTVKDVDVNATESRIEISNLENGIYLVSIKTGNNTSVKKLTINR